jgi:hypothetical protein
VFPATGRADTYQIYVVGDLQYQRVYGLAADGTVVLLYGSCDVGSITVPCYKTVVDGVTTAAGLTSPPNLTYDDGSPCTPTDPPPGMTIIAGDAICNNGLEVFETNTSGLYTGPDPVNDLVSLNENYGPFDLNASGDVVFHYGEDGIREAIDLTTQTPEPSGMALAGAGVVMAVEWFRRRTVRQPEA